MDEGRRTLVDMLVGIAIFAVLMAILGSFFKEVRWYFISGVVTGAVVAALLSFHMYRTVANCLDLDADEATSYTKRRAMVRLAIMVAVLVLAVFIGKEYMVLGSLMGMLCLKFSAYTQPLTHRFINRITRYPRKNM